MSRVNWPFLRTDNPTIVRTEGVYLYTADGRRVLDAAGGAIVANVGHGRERVAARVAEATRECTYVVPPWITPSRQSLVETLGRDWLPDSLTRIHITSGGSEAVEAGMKMALQYQAAIGRPERHKIIARSVSYHGTTVTTTALSGHPVRKRGLEHALVTYPRAPTPYPLRCPLGSHHPDAGRFYVEELRAVIEAEGPETIAALVAEPITGSSGGAIVPPEDYWGEVRRLCDEFGLLLILDEVMTGFGRTGRPFGYQHWDMAPDILVAGKGLAGGYAPIGGAYATEAVGTALKEAGLGVMFHTFGAHPAACAAATEVLNILTEEALVERAAQQGERLKARLESAFAQHPHVAEVRGRGLLLAIEVVRDRQTLEPYAEADNVANRIVGHALEHGVFFYGGGTGEVRDIVCMGPPFIIDDDHIDMMVDTLSRAVDEVTA
ncbi:MAG: aminotransferase class III-fold pyridoxal phosphate-dependent enzyme [Gammaproteobacteria bacterium]|nr:aminotransferase class III-fold pyridoxal phosphate-dependent enzyme [Gammaproteobacteria bacterium]